MSLSCWHTLDSPTLVSPPDVLNSFDGHVSKPHGIFIALPIEIRGKTVSIYVEVIDVALDSNLLLGCTWFYAMKVVASTVFRVLCFPHQGKSVTINQLDYCTTDLRPNANTIVPLISESASVDQPIGQVCLKIHVLWGYSPYLHPISPK